MQDPTAAQFLTFFPLFFAALWFAITSALGLMSGWFGLMGRFPDREDEVLARFGSQSGSMGPGVAMNGILSLTACRTGLRVGIWRIFGPFSRPFFVPWNDLQIERHAIGPWRRATLWFGNAGKLTVAADLADRLALATPGVWPEKVTLEPSQVRRRGVSGILLSGAAAIALAALFFTLAPRLVQPTGPHLPLAVSIGFPLVVFGVITLVRVAIRLGGRP